MLQTKIALRLLIHTFVRPGELRGARWEDNGLHTSAYGLVVNQYGAGTAIAGVAADFGAHGAKPIEQRLGFSR